MSFPRPLHWSGTGRKYFSMASRNLVLYTSGDTTVGILPEIKREVHTCGVRSIWSPKLSKSDRGTNSMIAALLNVPDISFGDNNRAITAGNLIHILYTPVQGHISLLTPSYTKYMFCIFTLDAHVLQSLVHSTDFPTHTNQTEVQLLCW